MGRLGATRSLLRNHLRTKKRSPPDRWAQITGDCAILESDTYCFWRREGDFANSLACRPAKGPQSLATSGRDFQETRLGGRGGGGVGRKINLIRRARELRNKTYLAGAGAEIEARDNERAPAAVAAGLFGF